MSTDLAPLESWIEAAEHAITAAHDNADGATLDEISTQCAAIAKTLTAVRGHAEVAILSLITDGHEVEGWKATDDAKVVWDAGRLLRQILADNDVPEVLAGKITSDLLTILPGTPTFRVGKPGESGLRSLGIFPDSFSDRVVSGKKAARS